jgi:DNA-binding NarL/FixJ family response regulator
MNILVADDHPLYRGALINLLLQLDDDVVITETDSFDQIREIANDDGNDFDLILLDLRMPGPSFREAITALREEQPTIPVVVVSASDSTVDVRNALDYGAQGYIPKSSSSAIMLSALNLVLSGGIYIPPLLLNESQPNDADLSQRSTAGSRDISPEGSRLTVRQKNVLSLMAEGQSNRDIAKNLNLAESTVKVHVTAILKALKVNNRTQAVINAAQYLQGMSKNELT